MVKHWYLKPHLIQDSKPSHKILWRLHLGVRKGWITVSGPVSKRESQSSEKAQRPKRNVWKSNQSTYLTCEGMGLFYMTKHTQTQQEMCLFNYAICNFSAACTMKVMRLLLQVTYHSSLLLNHYFCVDHKPASSRTQLKYYNSPKEQILCKGYSNFYSSSLIINKCDVQQNHQQEGTLRTEQTTILSVISFKNTEQCTSIRFYVCVY